MFICQIMETSQLILKIKFNNHNISQLIPSTHSLKAFSLQESKCDSCTANEVLIFFEEKHCKHSSLSLTHCTFQVNKTNSYQCNDDFFPLFFARNTSFSFKRTLGARLRDFPLGSDLQETSLELITLPPKEGQKKAHTTTVSVWHTNTCSIELK